MEGALRMKNQKDNFIINLDMVKTIVKYLPTVSNAGIALEGILLINLFLWWDQFVSILGNIILNKQFTRLAVKPSVAALDLITKSTEAITNTTSYLEKRRRKRKRLPRFFDERKVVLVTVPVWPTIFPVYFMWMSRDTIPRY
jgi:hypothetical protein